MTQSKNPLTEGSYTARRGTYTTLLYNERALRIVLKGAGRRYIAQQKADCKRYGWALYDESLLWEMLEEHWANSELETVRPEEVGALTDCTLFSLDTIRNDENEIVECGTVYGFQSCAIRSEIDEMLEEGECVLTSSW